VAVIAHCLDHRCSNIDHNHKEQRIKETNMATGFIYVVPSVGKDYRQPNLECVPTTFGGRIYFGPCKKPMRPRMSAGDYIFGISPSGRSPRRVVFAARVTEKMSFAEAYRRFPKLRGPVGPIHVQPARIPGPTFPESHYAHIPNANHADTWRSDIRTLELDSFFVCDREKECLGRWLGPAGPAVEGQILTFLKSCAVYGNAGLLSKTNSGANERTPVHYGNLFTGLHLETPAPRALLKLICKSKILAFPLVSGRSDSESVVVKETPRNRRSRTC